MAPTQIRQHLACRAAHECTRDVHTKLREQTMGEGVDKLRRGDPGQARIPTGMLLPDNFRQRRRSPKHLTIMRLRPRQEVQFPHHYPVRFSLLRAIRRRRKRA